MQPVKKKGVLYGERAFRPVRRPFCDWDAVRIALEVSRQGSFRGAAQQLNLSVDILRRRIKKLENALGVTLLIRNRDHVRITEEGEKIFAAALKMEAASHELVRLREEADVGVSGEVRLAVTEGLGTFWIAPRLSDFKRKNPNLLVNVHCAMKPADVLDLEADLAIQIIRPKALDMRRVKLGRLHLMPFATPEYLETHGKPKSITELVRHRVAVQAVDGAQWKAIYNRYFPGIPPSDLVMVRMNTSSANYWWIAKGGGIGFLPTYAYQLGTKLVPLDLGIHEQADIWLVYHPDVKRIPRISRLMDWIIQSFSPAKFPWFRNEFIHPNEFATLYNGNAPQAVMPDLPGGP